MVALKAALTLVLALSVVLLKHALAHHLEPLGPLPDWALNRSFSISRNGPMARFFDDDAPGKAALIDLRNHFREIDRRMEKRRNESNYGVTAADDLCNQQNEVNMVAVGVKTRTLGFGAFRSNCITELQSGDSRALWRTIMAFQAAIAGAGARALADSGLGWARAYPHSHFTHSSYINRCELAHAVSFRIGRVWSVLGSVTEHPTNIRKEDKNRQYLEEFLTPGEDGGARIRNLFMKLPSFRDRSVWVNDTTDSVSIWGGIPASSIFAERAPLDENPGIDAALARGRAWIQAAEDSQAASNIAIMVLSLSLALVPLALFADVGALAALAYALVTDVMSCLPLFIKGLELVALSGRTHADARTWVYGMETAADIAIAETWAAQCRSHRSLLVLGASFSSVAAAAMVTGVTLEIVARRKLLKEKTLVGVTALAARNDALTQMWARETHCTECNCYAMQSEKVRPAASQALGSTGILAHRQGRGG